MKLSIRKILNALECVVSYMLSTITHRTVCLGMPFLYSIEPVSYCNLHCPECPSGNGSLKRKRTAMPMAVYQHIIEEIKQYSLHLTLYFQGEPLLCKDFCKMAETANKEGLFTSTSTNGQLITETVAEDIVSSGLNHIIISIDGATQENYEKYRVGGSIEKAFDAITLIKKAKEKLHSKTPQIEAQMLVFKHNEKDINNLQIKVKRLGADRFTLKTALIYDYHNGSDFMPRNTKYSRYVKQQDGTYRLKRKLHNRCYRLFTAMVITAEGDICPCAFDKDADHSYGNIHTKRLKDIWRGDEARAFRNEVLKNRANVKICNNCVY